MMRCEVVSNLFVEKERKEQFNLLLKFNEIL